MVTGRRMTFDISRPATLNQRNDFRAISRLRHGSRSVIDGMHNSLNHNHASTRRNAWHHRCLLVTSRRRA